MRDVSPKMRLVDSAFDPDERVGQFLAEEDADAFLDAGDGRKVVDRFAAGPKREMHGRVRQGDARERFGDMTGLGGIGLQERATDGGVEKEVADFDRRADVAPLL